VSFSSLAAPFHPWRLSISFHLVRKVDPMSEIPVEANCNALVLAFNKEQADSSRLNRD